MLDSYFEFPTEADQAFFTLKRTLISLDSANPELEARWILEKRAGIMWKEGLVLRDIALTERQINNIQEDLKRRAAQEPLTKIYEEAYFWDYKFKITKDTLDPRPETELIVELALKRFQESPPEKILDLGTGTGCILLTLLKLFPKAHGLGVDISEKALQVANENAKTLDVQDRITFKKGNWLENIEETYDLVVGNPPYIENQALSTLPESVRNFDPREALDGGKDGLQAYKDIFSRLNSVLKPCGLGLFEIGWNQDKNIKRLVEESTLKLVEIYPDYAGLPRVVEIYSGDK